MKRSILTALVMSVLLWCCFTGFGYLEQSLLFGTSLSFERGGFWANFACVLAPYLICAVIAAVLRVPEDRNMTAAAALVYLVTTVLAFVLATRLRLPLYHDGHRVYGTYSFMMPPVESCFMLCFFFTFTFTRVLANRRKSAK